MSSKTRKECLSRNLDLFILCSREIFLVKVLSSSKYLKLDYLMTLIFLNFFEKKIKNLYFFNLKNLIFIKAIFLFLDNIGLFDSSIDRIILKNGEN